MKVWTNTHSIFQQISTSALVLCLASVIIGTWLRLFLFLFLTFTACFYIEKSQKLPVLPYINKTMTFITFIRTQPQPTYQLRTLKTSNSCPLNFTSIMQWYRTQDYPSEHDRVCMKLENQVRKLRKVNFVNHRNSQFPNFN